MISIPTSPLTVLIVERHEASTNGKPQMIRKQVKKWNRASNPNCCRLLDAEQAASEGKHDKADGLYKEAIKFSARVGHLHHAALFSEEVEIRSCQSVSSLKMLADCGIWTRRLVLG